MRDLNIVVLISIEIYIYIYIYIERERERGRESERERGREREREREGGNKERDEKIIILENSCRKAGIDRDTTLETSESIKTMMQ